MDYLERIDHIETEELLWNVPEQKKGAISIVGGNIHSFRTSVKTAEYLTGQYPIKDLKVVLPGALKTKLPPLDNLVFLKSTESGTFLSDKELKAVLNEADSNLVVGDLSKNSVTTKAFCEACQDLKKPTIITRDAVDLLVEGKTEQILMNENIVLMGSMAQLQKIFRAVYYPKVLLLAQSLIQVAEALHKFTLSYPVSIITLHSGQIIIVKNGKVNVVPLEKTDYSPLSIWSGELAAKIMALNLYNPNNFLKATVAAIIK